jgi:hypothetical protein
VGWQQLEAAIAALRAAVGERAVSSRTYHGEMQHRAALENSLVRKFVTPVSKFARGQLNGTPAFAALTPSLGGLQGKALVEQVRGLATAAAPFAERMEGAHFAHGFLNDLTAAVNAVEASVETMAQARRRRQGAVDAVRDALQQGRDAVRTLDSIVSHIILGQGPLEAEWRAAKRITQSSGVRRNADAEPTAAPKVKDEKAA